MRRLMVKSESQVVSVIVRRRFHCLADSLRSSCLALRSLPPPPTAAPSQLRDTPNPSQAFNPQGNFLSLYYRAIGEVADVGGPIYCTKSEGDSITGGLLQKICLRYGFAVWMAAMMADGMKRPSLPCAKGWLK